MGHLEQDDAAFLAEAAKTFRAVDHGMRLYTGQSGNTLPDAPAARDALWAMLDRWLPGHHSPDHPEPDLDTLQERTRETYERLFS